MAKRSTKGAFSKEISTIKKDLEKEVVNIVEEQLSNIDVDAGDITVFPNINIDPRYKANLQAELQRQTPDKVTVKTELEIETYKPKKIEQVDLASMVEMKPDKLIKEIKKYYADADKGSELAARKFIAGTKIALKKGLDVSGIAPADVFDFYEKEYPKFIKNVNKELQKVDFSPLFATSSNKQYDDVVGAFKGIIKESQKSGSVEKFLSGIANGSIEATNKVKDLLEMVKILSDGKYKISGMQSGTKHMDGIVSDQYTIIGRALRDDQGKDTGVEDKINALIPKLQAAKQEGVQLGSILGVIKDEAHGIVYEIQETQHGKIINEDNLDFLEATDQELLKLKKDLAVLQKLGIFIDTGAGMENLIYKKGKGFSFIDLAVPKDAKKIPEHMKNGYTDIMDGLKDILPKKGKIVNMEFVEEIDEELNKRFDSFRQKFENVTVDSNSQLEQQVNNMTGVVSESINETDTQIKHLEDSVNEYNKVISKMKKPGFHVGNIEDNPEHISDNLQSKKDLNRIGSGIFWMTDIDDALTYLEQINDKGEKAKLYITDLGKVLGDMVHISGDADYEEYIDFLGKFNQFVMTVVSDNPAQYAEKLEKSGISNLHDLYNYGKRYFDEFDITEEKLNEIVQDSAAYAKANIDSVKETDDLSAYLQSKYMGRKGVTTKDGATLDNYNIGSVVFHKEDLGDIFAADSKDQLNSKVVKKIFKQALLEKAQNDKNTVEEFDELLETYQSSPVLKSIFTNGELEDIITSMENLHREIVRSFDETIDALDSKSHEIEDAYNASEKIAKKAGNLKQLREQEQILRMTNHDIQLYEDPNNYRVGAHGKKEFLALGSKKTGSSYKELKKIKAEILALNPALEQVADNAERISRSNFEEMFKGVFDEDDLLSDDSILSQIHEKENQIINLENQRSELNKKNTELYKETNGDLAKYAQLSGENLLAIQRINDSIEILKRELQHLRADAIQEQLESASESTEVWFRRVHDVKEVLQDTGGFFAKDLRVSETYFDPNSSTDRLLTANIDTSKMLDVDAQGKRWNNLSHICDQLIEDAKILGISLDDLEDKERNVFYGNTKWIAGAAEKLGYLGVRIRNVIDVGGYADDFNLVGDVLQVFDSSLVSNVQDVTDAYKGLSNEFVNIQEVSRVSMNVPKDISSAWGQTVDQLQMFSDEEKDIWSKISKLGDLRKELYDWNIDHNINEEINPLLEKLRLGQISIDDFLSSYNDIVNKYSNILDSLSVDKKIEIVQEKLENAESEFLMGLLPRNIVDGLEQKLKALKEIKQQSNETPVSSETSSTASQLEEELDARERNIRATDEQITRERELKEASEEASESVAKAQSELNAQKQSEPKPNDKKEITGEARRKIIFAKRWLTETTNTINDGDGLDSNKFDELKQKGLDYIDLLKSYNVSIEELEQKFNDAIKSKEQLFSSDNSVPEIQNETRELQKEEQQIEAIVKSKEKLPKAKVIFHQGQVKNLAKEIANDKNLDVAKFEKLSNKAKEHINILKQAGIETSQLEETFNNITQVQYEKLFPNGTEVPAIDSVTDSLEKEEQQVQDTIQATEKLDQAQTILTKRKVLDIADQIAKDNTLDINGFNTLARQAMDYVKTLEDAGVVTDKIKKKFNDITQDRYQKLFLSEDSSTEVEELHNVEQQAEATAASEQRLKRTIEERQAVQDVQENKDDDQITAESAKFTSEEAKAMAELFDKAIKAAEAKKEFADANKDVLKSIISSLSALNSEGDGFKNLNKIINNLTDDKDGRIQKLRINLAMIKETLSSPIDDNSFINAIREIAQQGDSLKDLANVLKISKNQIGKVKNDGNQDDVSVDVSTKESEDRVKKAIDLQNKLYDMRIAQSKIPLGTNIEKYKLYSSIIDELEKDIKALNLSTEEQAVVLTETAEKATLVTNAYNEMRRKSREAEESAERLRANVRKQATDLLSNGKLMKEYGNDVRDIIKRIDEINTSVDPSQAISELKRLQTELKNISSTAKEAGKSGKTFGQMITQRFKSLGAYLATFVQFYDIVRYVRQAAESVQELDKQMIELAKVSDQSLKQIKSDFASYSNIAKDLGSTISDTISATADWARFNKIDPLYGNI